MLDAPYTQPDKSAFDIDRIGVKASQFSFARLHKADPVLGVDMSSTGEVGCMGDDFRSIAECHDCYRLQDSFKEKGVMFSSGAMKSKVDLLDASRMLLRKVIRFMLQPVQRFPERTRREATAVGLLAG